MGQDSINNVSTREIRGSLRTKPDRLTYVVSTTQNLRSSLDTAHGNPLFLSARSLARKKESCG